MTQPKFDPFPAATAFDYQFPRALDAWEWLDENGFQEKDSDCYVKDGWLAELRREPNDKGDKPVHVALLKRGPYLTGSH